MLKRRILIPLACFGMCAIALHASDGADPLAGIDWGQWGLAGLVTGVTMYLSWQRETRMAASMEAREAWIRDELITVLKRVADAPCQREKEK